MAAAAVPYIIMGVAATAKAYGQYKSNMDQGAAEDRNAQFYDEQAAYSAEVGKRKLKLLGQSQEQFLGKQKSMFAASGISFSGSAFDEVISTQMQQEEERRALVKQNEMETRLVASRANASRQMAGALRDPNNNLLQVGGTLLTAGAAVSNTAGSKG